jgi:hypothetical protein
MKSRRVPSGWAVTFAPRDEEWEWLELTVHLGEHAATTRIDAAHVGSSSLLTLIAEQMAPGYLRTPSGWRIVRVRRTFELQGEAAP